MPSVAAVVVTYNRKPLLRQCLTALQAQTHPLAAIYVVDNASSDGTAAMVRAEFPGVTLLRLDENRGGAGGFHAGMKAALDASSDAAVDWVWVMDDDAAPEPDALAALFAPGVHEGEDTVALTPLKRYPTGRPQYDQVGTYDPAEFVIRPIGPDDLQVGAEEDETDVVDVGYGAFVGLLVSAAVVRRVGLPDSSFFLWYDDVEYCLRLKTEGRIVLVPDSTIVHHVDDPGDVDAAKPWRNRPMSYFWRYYYSIRNRTLLVARYVPDVQDRIRGWVRALQVVLRAIASVLLYAESDRAARVRLLVQGFVDGLAGRTGKRVDPASFTKPSAPDASPPDAPPPDAPTSDVSEPHASK